MAVKQLDSVVRPTAVALSTWTWATIVLKGMVQDFSRALGFGADPPPPTTWHSTLPGLKDIYGATPHSSPPGSGAMNSQVGMKGQPPQGSGIELTEVEKRMQEHAQLATQGALLTFSKNWKPIKRPPTRGCVRVDGLVEVQGEKAVMAVWVLGWYDPKLKKFVGIETKLKHMIPLKQRPAPN